jgi:hypothetical protein
LVQKAVEELGSNGILDKGGKEANYHLKDLEGLMLSTSQELDSINIQKVANETAQKASEMMSPYLGYT